MGDGEYITYTNGVPNPQEKGYNIPRLLLLIIIVFSRMCVVCSTSSQVHDSQWVIS